MMKNYKALTIAVGNVLKSKGFIKKGESFYLFKMNNWGVLNFQKSKSSTADDVSFTINVGIFSTAIARNIRNHDLSNNPDIADCHWRKRIGFMLPEKKDYWWKINSGTYESICDEITNILITLAIPQLEDHISDDDLEKEWLNGGAEGATEL